MKVAEYLKLERSELISYMVANYPEPKTLAFAGNSKLGKTIGHISSMAKLSCIPSEWCIQNCYAIYENQKVMSATFNPEKRGMANYVKNAYFSHWSETDPEKLRYMLRQTFKYEPYRVYRFFVEGDWEFVAQIQVVRELLAQDPSIRIFFFTRSWQSKPLLVELDKLIELPNVKGFASYDTTMEQPPEDWLRAEILGQQLGGNNIVCPEQLQEVPSCGRCGLCFNKKVTKNILFVDHSIKEYRDLKRFTRLGKEEEANFIRKQLKIKGGQIRS